MTTPLSPPQPAGLWRRLAAMGYDGLLVFGLLFVATSIYGLLGGLGSRLQTVSNDQVIHQLEPVAQGPLFTLYLILVCFGFFAIFWRKNGQTLGMQAWRLQLVSDSSTRLSWGQCAIRFAGAIISAACFGAGYWWLWLDRSGRCWHDYWSKTRVIVLPKSR